MINGFNFQNPFWQNSITSTKNHQWSCSLRSLRPLASYSHAVVDPPLLASSLGGSITKQQRERSVFSFWEGYFFFAWFSTTFAYISGENQLHPISITAPVCCTGMPTGLTGNSPNEPWKLMGSKSFQILGSFRHQNPQRRSTYIVLTFLEHLWQIILCWEHYGNDLHHRMSCIASPNVMQTSRLAGILLLTLLLP